MPCCRLCHRQSAQPYAMMIRVASVSHTFSERGIHAVRMLKNNDNIRLDKLGWTCTLPNLLLTYMNHG